MAPILLSGILSVADNVISAYREAAQAKSAQAQAQQQGSVNFNKMVAQTAQPLRPGDVERLRTQLMQSPEVQAALMENHFQDVKLQISPDGGLAVVQPNGEARPLVVSTVTQAIAQRLVSVRS